MNKVIRIFAPATVANVGPGFDILGLALEGIGDEIEMSLSANEGIRIVMPGSDLPSDPNLNVAGVAVQALLDDLNITQGVDMKIHKKVLPGSGLGSSASSAAGAVYALNELLGTPYSRPALVKFAMAGEAASSGKAHADNVAPSLMGGFTLVRSYDPLDVINLVYPESMIVVVVHPQIEVKTADSKKILRKDVPMEMAIKQWGNVAGLVAGLASSDYTLISRSLQDAIVEPVRSMLIPAFAQLKEAAKEGRALGCSISGSGPSVFALCTHMDQAREIGSRFQKIYHDLNIEQQVHISTINKEGAKVI